MVASFRRYIKCICKIKLKSLALITSLLICFYLSGCYYRNEQDLYPAASTCDTLNVTYSLSVKPILTNSCYSCHAGSGEEGVILNTYSGVKQYISNGILIEAVTHTGNVTPMPYDQPKLDNCQIAIIEKWVKNGALDN